MVGHYTQLISNTVGRVGCGLAIVNGMAKAICNYGEMRMSDQNPYTNGTSCSGCAGNLCQNNLCTCSKFCVNYGQLNLQTCSCTCQPFTYGDQCQYFSCNRTDASYGCPQTGNTFWCQFSNTVYLCPHTCGICDYVRVP